MKVIVAESAGFCYGVKRAVELAEQAAVAGSPCQMLGPINHNEHVDRNLAQAGIPCAAEPEEIPAGSTAIIRSHGESREVYQRLER